MGSSPLTKISSRITGVYCGWDEALLFGSHSPKISSKSTRRLQTSNLEANGMYLLSLHAYFDRHKIFKRLSALEEQKEVDGPKAEKLDRDITRGMLHSEKHCRYRGQDPWSPKLKKARMKVEIFKLNLSMTRTKRDYQARIDKLVNEYSDTIELPETIASMKISLRTAQSELRVVLKAAIVERKKFLQEKQIAATISNDSKEILKWKNQQKAEDIKAMYKKLRFIRRDGTRQQGLTQIQVPSDPSDDPKSCTDWKTIDTPEEITRYLLARNQAHFGQAAGTPFSVPPLSVQVDFSASTET